MIKRIKQRFKDRQQRRYETYWKAVMSELDRGTYLY